MGREVLSDGQTVGEVAAGVAVAAEAGTCRRHDVDVFIPRIFHLLISGIQIPKSTKMYRH